MTAARPAPAEAVPGDGATRAQLSAVAWVAGGDLAFDDWLRQGSRLGVAGRNVSWWLGDWLRYGASRYGQKYTLAARVTGYDHQTLMNMVYVAARFGDISRRREKLSWSHHAEVAALDAEDQDRWLDCSLRERLSVRDLRRELASARHVEEARRLAAEAGEDAVGDDGEETARAEVLPVALVTCPQCGHAFQNGLPRPGLAARPTPPAPM